ncbi:U20-hexatoxin-Hi1a-like [Centruroides vittatus]|uniref:U20-hexatoxin-Hi1a-like n=1 Tax=Centruroides vittatus TaxID=120091 RepID=UPI00350F39EE
MKTFVAFLCLAAVLGRALSDKTACQISREKALEENSLVKIVPECDENGEYAPKQCFPGNKFCQCVRKDGSAIVEMSAIVKHCECMRARDLAVSRHLIGNYRPQCEKDGTYSRTQCWGSVGSCWCVDERGNKLLDKNAMDC